MSQYIILTKGLPASGKSTWAKEFCIKDQSFVRVCRDDLREMRGKYWIPKQEKMITKMEDDCIISALSFGHSVIVDATNLNEDRNKQRVNKWVKESGIVDYDFIYEDFTGVDLYTCLARDSKREKSTGSDVIINMYNKYLRSKNVYQEDERLPHCVIFDVDGTLAKMNGRSPYDWQRVDEDSVNEPVAMLARYTHDQGIKNIIFTGRDRSCLDKTIGWLNKNNIPFYDIFMREEGNNEKDSIVKRRIFDEEIKGNYYVEFVVDDRDQVVRMWRDELGLTCLQADYGNF